MCRILVLNGPNLNLLGVREPSVYGVRTLEQIMERVAWVAKDMGFFLVHYQSNSEGALVDRIQKTLEDATTFIIFNPGGYTHSSIALRDALLAVNKPFVEVHLSNVFARENFRSKSYLSSIAKAVISGAGSMGYEFALHIAKEYLHQKHEDQK